MSRPTRSLTEIDPDKIEKYVLIAMKTGLIKDLDTKEFAASESTLLTHSGR